jgi:hypothetical protein
MSVECTNTPERGDELPEIKKENIFTQCPSN